MTAPAPAGMGACARAWTSRGAAWVLVVCAAACQSAGTREPETALDVLQSSAADAGAGAANVAPFAAVPGSQYPDLLAAGSEAVFLRGTDLLERLEEEARVYAYPPAEVEAHRERIAEFTAQYHVCEVRLVSNFGDAAIAHEAVTLRSLRATLEDDTGQVIPAAAVQAGPSEEIAVGHDRAFTATSMALFPRFGPDGVRPLVHPATQTLRITLSGHGSAFIAEWHRQPTFPR